MKKGVLKIVSLLLVSVMLTITSLNVNASSVIGDASLSNIPNSASQISEVQKKGGFASGLARGFAAGYLVGTAVGFYSRLGYEYVTGLIGGQKSMSLSSLNYDPNDLKRFDGKN
jgi:hypothetical protein